jgi:DNA helicase-2/ATP-dependent DNA helicase PcrA
VGNKAAERLWQQYHDALPGTAVAASLPYLTPAEQESDAGSGATNSEPDGTPPQWSPASAMHHCQGLVPKKATDGWKQLVETLRQLEGQETRNLPGKMLRIVVEAGYEDYLKENYPNYRNRLEDLEQLAAFSGQFPSLEEFLTQLSLLTNLEAESQQSQSRDDEKLRLSSIHQAKGLEWDVVFIIMLCENLFPSERSLQSKAGEEEERRLFYVALTRARKELYLSYPAMRFVQGGYMDAYLQPSRFLDELPRDLLDVWKLTAY